MMMTAKGDSDKESQTRGFYIIWFFLHTKYLFTTAAMAYLQQ